MNVVDRSVPVSEQTWRSKLVMVASMPSRFVGILEDREFDKAMQGAPFVLTNVLTYVANYGLQPVAGGHSLIVRPHELLPFDLLSDVKTLTIKQWDHLIRVAEQPEQLSSWMYERYMNYYDPPRLVGTDKIVLGG
jgi:hypothetical protein